VVACSSFVNSLLEKPQVFIFIFYYFIYLTYVIIQDNNATEEITLQCFVFSVSFREEPRGSRATAWGESKKLFSRDSRLPKGKFAMQAM